MNIDKRLIELSRRIARDQAEFIHLKELRRTSESSETVTVYTVRETRVKAYTRRGFTAVRVGGAR